MTSVAIKSYVNDLTGDRKAGARILKEATHAKTEDFLMFSKLSDLRASGQLHY